MQFSQKIMFCLSFSACAEAENKLKTRAHGPIGLTNRRATNGHCLAGPNSQPHSASKRAGTDAQFVAIRRCFHPAAADRAEGMDCCRYVNPFRACAGLRGLGYLMVAIVAAVVAVSYYAVVVYAWGPMLLGGGAEAAGAAAVLAGFHVLVGNDGLDPLALFSL
jgi:hypothetical protein